MVTYGCSCLTQLSADTNADSQFFTFASSSLLCLNAWYMPPRIPTAMPMKGRCAAMPRGGGDSDI